MAIRDQSTAKVGSDNEAARHFAGSKRDFGMTTQEAVDTAREEGIEDRPAGSAPGYSGAQSIRTTGVGSAGGEAGHDSGGDLDPEVIGFGDGAGLSAKPVLGHIDGPDDAGDPSKTFASGKTKRRLNRIKLAAHGAAPNAQGDYVDHSGSDASAVNPDEPGNETPRQGAEPGAEGEISHAEATGDVEEGGEI
jgi:hypothetical protein